MSDKSSNHKWVYYNYPLNNNDENLYERLIKHNWLLYIRTTHYAFCMGWLLVEYKSSIAFYVFHFIFY